MTEQIIKCIICGKNIPKERIKQNKKTCCKRCQMLTPESKQKRSMIMKKCYENPETKQKLSKSMKKLWQNETYINNVTNGLKKAMSKPEYHENLSKSLKAYHSSDRHQNFIEAMNKPETKQKMSEAQLKRFQNKELYESFIEAMNKPETKEKLKKVMLLPETQNKIYSTKKQNNSFNISKPEKEILQLLQQKFNKVHHQYRSELYPFNCDFYIEDLDLYIECHFNWTHGSMPYDENNIDCINQLNEWKEKSKTSDFYQNAIYQWTDLDVRKRQCAIDNGLNWIAFYSYKEFEQWLNNLDI